MSTTPATPDPAAALADTAVEAGSVAAELTDQVKTQAKAPAKAAKAPARKTAPAKSPAAKAPATTPEPPADDDPGRPLTQDEKRQLGAAVVTAVAAAFGNKLPAAVKTLPADTARAQVAQWMAYVPTGGKWPTLLPRPAKR